MKTGFAGSIDIGDKLGVSGDILIEMEWDNGGYLCDYLSKEQATEIISHLKNVFDLEG